MGFIDILTRDLKIQECYDTSGRDDSIRDIETGSSTALRGGSGYDGQISWEHRVCKVVQGRKYIYIYIYMNTHRTSTSSKCRDLAEPEAQ